jgi:hypothetical protein
MNNTICIATLLEGSALGSSILGVIFALVYIKKHNIKTKLKINVNNASKPAKTFFNKVTENELFEIINLPVSIKTINGVNHPCSSELDGIELFYSPGMQGYDLFETDFDILYNVFVLFNNVTRTFERTNKETANDVCVHVRRGDKLIYESQLKVHTIEEYIKKINENSLNKNIIVVTDDYDTYLEFKTKCPDWNICTTSSEKNRGFNISNINKENQTNVTDEVERMCEDFKIIFSSNFFIGTKSSSVSYLGKLSRGNSRTILLD